MEITREERKFIIEMHDRYRLGPIALEKKIEREHGIHIPHKGFTEFSLKRERLWKILRKENKEGM